MSQDSEEASHNWSYLPSSRAGVFFRGETGSQDTAFCGWIVIKVQETREDIFDLEAVSGEDTELFDDIDPFQAPGSIRSDFKSVKSEMDRQALKDSKKFSEKMRRLLRTRVFLSNLARCLRSNDTQRFKGMFSRRLREAIFPGDSFDVDIHIYNLRDFGEPSSSDEESEEDEEEETDDRRSKYLEVIPHISQSSNRKLKQVQEGEILEVRIVGEVVNKLKDEFREKARGRLRSIPFPAKLLAIERYSRSMLDFVVKLSESIAGRGRATRDSHVNVVKPVGESNRESQWTFIVIFLLVAAMFIVGSLFLLFPMAGL